MLPMLMRGFQRPAAVGLETDVWFTTQNVKDAFEAIEKEANAWKENEKFEVGQSMPPRLIRVRSKREGEISFELTEVEGGGSSVKAMFTPEARFRVQTLRAQLPVNIPIGIGKPCPSCGKSILPDFALCPYCGFKLKGAS